VVGLLLHLVKHSKPDIANSVRELAKCMDGANPAAYKEMKRVLKFVINTLLYGLKVYPLKDQAKQRWVLAASSDSEWAGDKTTRKSVSGYSVFLMGAVGSWQSKIRKPVALSSSEAEYYALSEAAREIKFVVQTLEHIGMEIELPVLIYCDNVGAIFMSENATATTRMKHVDTRYHFVREFVFDKFVEIVFVKSDEKSQICLLKMFLVIAMRNIRMSILL
jgi:hypothetical protein